jgi:hypothetical protein
MSNKIKLLTATAVLSLLSACGGGGGGTTGPTTPPVVTPPVVISPEQGYYNTILSETLTRNVTFESNKEVNGAYAGSGVYTSTPLIADSFRGSPALSRTMTIRVSLPNGPLVLTEKQYYDSNYKRIGTTNDVGSDVVTNLVDFSKKSTSSFGTYGDLYNGNFYSNNLFTTLIGTKLVTWTNGYQSLDSLGRPTGLLLFTLKNRYYFPNSTYAIERTYNTQRGMEPISFYYYDSSKDLQYKFLFI